MHAPTGVRRQALDRRRSASATPGAGASPWHPRAGSCGHAAVRSCARGRTARDRTSGAHSGAAKDAVESCSENVLRIACRRGAYSRLDARQRERGRDHDAEGARADAEGVADRDRGGVSVGAM